MSFRSAVKNPKVKSAKKIEILRYAQNDNPKQSSKTPKNQLVNVNKPFLNKFKLDTKLLSAIVKPFFEIARPLSAIARLLFEIAHPLSAIARLLFEIAQPLSAIARSLLEIDNPLSPHSSALFEDSSLLLALVQPTRLYLRSALISTLKFLSGLG